MTEPNGYFNHDVGLKAGTRARADHVNTRFNSVVQGFAKLPDPHETLKGFSSPVAVGVPTNLAHAVSISKVLSGGMTYAEDTGVASAYIVDLPVAPLSYVNGLRFSFLAINANTGAATVDLNNLGIKQLVRADGAPLAAGDIIGGQIVTVIYNNGKLYGVATFPGQLVEAMAQAQLIIDSAGQGLTALEDAAEQVALAEAQVALATAQVALAVIVKDQTVTLGAEQVTLAADQVTLAADQVALAVIEKNQTVALGAEQVALAADEVVNAAGQVTLAADQVAIAAGINAGINELLNERITFDQLFAGGF